MTTIAKDISDYKVALDEIMDYHHFHPMAVLKKEAALDQFLQLGIPSMRHEDWKYTYLQKYLNKGFVPGRVEKNDLSEDIHSILSDIPVTQAVRLVMMDGYFYPQYSILPEIKGLSISGILESSTEQLSEMVEKQSSLADIKKHALTALNIALSQDGLIIRVEESVETGIDFINIITNAGHQIRQPYCQITVLDNAKLTIHEHQVLIGQIGMMNAVTEIFLSENAVLNWVKVQDPGVGACFIDTAYVQQASSSTYNVTAITLTGTLLRNQQYVSLNGIAAHADLSGLYLLDKEEQADNLIYVRHRSPECTSNQLFKGVMDGSSTGTFNGKIVVDQDAQKTNAFQSNKNILISEDASAFFRPQLEIFADDVKCSHGATSSEIEDSELFYLRARGIGKEKAKSLLMLAFATDVVEHIANDDLKAFVVEKIEAKLKLNA
jgi:Fe-S cluster assembly protein SufD